MIEEGRVNVRVTTGRICLRWVTSKWPVFFHKFPHDTPHKVKGKFTSRPGFMLWIPRVQGSVSQPETRNFCLEVLRVEQVLFFYLFLCCISESFRFYYNFYFHICVKTWRETTCYLYFILPTSCTIKIYEIILRRTVPEMLRNTGIWYMFVKANVFPDTGVANLFLQRSTYYLNMCCLPHIDGSRSHPERSEFGRRRRRKESCRLQREFVGKYERYVPPR